MQLNFFEFRRHLLHVFVGGLLLINFIYNPYAIILASGILILGILFSILSARMKIPGIYHCLCAFERSCNKNFPGKGVIFFFISSILMMMIFPRNIALASIAILTFSDPLAHFVGQNFGKIRSRINMDKKIEGTIAGIIGGWVAAGLFVPSYLAFLGSGIAMVFELGNFRIAGEKIDDNFIIPLVSAIIMWVISIL